MRQQGPQTHPHVETAEAEEHGGVLRTSDFEAFEAQPAGKVDETQSLHAHGAPHQFVVVLFDVTVRDGRNERRSGKNQDGEDGCLMSVIFKASLCA